ncbi:MAG: enolase, partial [Candidatus Caldarchaeum sp.]|nr:enolase [Candidatus Caldarchaeum sp.]MDW8436355.1 hypothetical protein [Candidatus Caldarchaeum sp.]
MSRESFKITNADAWVILDSRGSETVEVELSSGSVTARASAPSGKSRGTREAVPFPEKGASGSVDFFRRVLRQKLIGFDPADQKGVDELLKKVDGTQTFSNIGGNLAYAVSACSTVLASKLKQIPAWRYLSNISRLKPGYPIPLGNVLGGGAHAGEGAPDIQEFLVFPTKARNVEEALKTNVEIHKRLGKILSKVAGNYGGGKGDEGAYAPPIDDETALGTVKEAAGSAAMGLDVAASSLYDPSKDEYLYKNRNLRKSKDQHFEFLSNIVEKY